jgi:hypothetical protein
VLQIFQDILPQISTLLYEEESVPLQQISTLLYKEESASLDGGYLLDT